MLGDGIHTADDLGKQLDFGRVFCCEFDLWWFLDPFAVPVGCVVVGDCRRLGSRIAV